ncbi:MAG: putative DNA-binding domain-containing protein [Pseudoxanthomonas sp.]
MSELQALQQRTLQAVLSARSSRMRELLGDGVADATSRLDVYRQGYRVRLRDALVVEFPGLGLLAGRRFKGLLESYVDTHPSGHYNIRWHGAGLQAFLEYGLPWRERPELAEMARLDWAISTAFDAADEKVVAVADLAGVPPSAWAELHLRPQGHLQILSGAFNVEAFRRAADRNKPRPRLRRCEMSRHCLVWRQSLEVRYRLIDDDEQATLTAAMRGESFALLCDRMASCHEPSMAMPRMAALLRQWLDDGLIAGWRLLQDSM